MVLVVVVLWFRCSGDGGDGYVAVNCEEYGGDGNMVVVLMVAIVMLVLMVVLMVMSLGMAIG